MHLLITASDHAAPEGPARRTVARQRHLAHLAALPSPGRLLYAGALLDATGTTPVGSVLLVDVPSRGLVDAWLAVDPYVTERVWERVEVRVVRPAERPAERR